MDGYPLCGACRQRHYAGRACRREDLMAALDRLTQPKPDAQPLTMAVLRKAKAAVARVTQPKSKRNAPSKRNATHKGGRERVHASAADRQRAYRARKAKG